MDLNWINIMFVLMTLVIVVIGCLVNWVEDHVPIFLSQVMRYGKHSSGKPASFLIKIVQLPKRWFSHFYLFAASFTAFILVVASNLYFTKSSLQPWMLASLDFLAPGRKVTTTVASTYIALLMITLQCWHRFYETWFVSVFSDSRINLAHYLVGYLHYFGAVTAIILEAPGFNTSSTEQTVAFDFREIRIMDIFGLISFMWACYNQYKHAVLLANLRKNTRGEVVSHKHSIPKGGWFNYVSSPHLLAEILMYLSLMIVLNGSQTWPYVCVWVVSNQVETALLTHWWYKGQFKNYPKKRKAILPLIY